MVDDDARAVTIDPTLFTVIIRLRLRMEAERGEALVREPTEVVGRTVVTRPGFR